MAQQVSFCKLLTYCFIDVDAVVFVIDVDVVFATVIFDVDVVFWHRCSCTQSIFPVVGE